MGGSELFASEGQLPGSVGGVKGSALYFDLARQIQISENIGEAGEGVGSFETFLFRRGHTKLEHIGAVEELRLELSDCLHELWLERILLRLVYKVGAVGSILDRMGRHRCRTAGLAQHESVQVVGLSHFLIREQVGAARGDLHSEHS